MVLVTLNRVFGLVRTIVVPRLSQTTLFRFTSVRFIRVRRNSLVCISKLGERGNRDSRLPRGKPNFPASISIQCQLSLSVAYNLTTKQASKLALQIEVTGKS